MILLLRILSFFIWISDIARAAIPTTGLFSQYSADSYSAATPAIWKDSSGNGRDAAVTGISIATDEFGKTIITGSTTSTVIFPTADLDTNKYTLFYRAKYNGFNKGRIFTWSIGQCNWLSGFFVAKSGVAYRGGTWLTDVIDHFGSNWVVGTDQTSLYRGNGMQLSTTNAPYGYFCGLAINVNYYDFNGASDFAVSDVIIYSRELSLAEILQVEATLLPNQPTETPNTAPPTATLFPTKPTERSTTRPSAVPTSLPPSLKPTTAKPIARAAIPTTGLFSQYSADSYSAATPAIWKDSSGNGRDAAVTGISIATDEFGKTIITGSTTSTVIFPTADLDTNKYTLFYRAKYNGFNKGRIFTWSIGQCNWLSGFFVAKSGVAYRGGTWLTDVIDHFGSNWVVGTDQTSLYRGNGMQLSTTNAPYGYFCGLAINVNYYDFNGASDFAVSDVIIYSRELSLAEILQVEATLLPNQPSSPSPRPPTVKPTVVPTVFVPPSRYNYFLYNGKYFSTLDDADLNGVPSYCQSYYRFVPANWILAPDDSDSLKAISLNSWSTKTVVVASGVGYYSKYPSGLNNKAYSNWLLKSYNGASAGYSYSCIECPCEVLIMYSPSSVPPLYSSSTTSDSYSPSLEPGEIFMIVFFPVFFLIVGCAVTYVFCFNKGSPQHIQPVSQQEVTTAEHFNEPHDNAQQLQPQPQPSYMVAQSGYTQLQTQQLNQPRQDYFQPQPQVHEEVLSYEQPKPQKVSGFEQPQVHSHYEQPPPNQEPQINGRYGQSPTNQQPLIYGFFEPQREGEGCGRPKPQPQVQPGHSQPQQHVQSGYGGQPQPQVQGYVHPQPQVLWYLQSQSQPPQPQPQVQYHVQFHLQPGHGQSQPQSQVYSYGNSQLQDQPRLQQAEQLPGGVEYHSPPQSYDSSIVHPALAAPIFNTNVHVYPSGANQPSRDFRG